MYLCKDIIRVYLIYSMEISETPLHGDTPDKGTRFSRAKGIPFTLKNVPLYRNVTM